MSFSAPGFSDVPPPQAVEEVVSLIRKGRPLSALALWPDLKARAPHWQDAKTLTNAARIMERTGDVQTARRWHRLNFRRHPEDDYCFLYRAFELGGTIGLPRTLSMLEARLRRPGLQVKRRADLLALAAGFLGAVRDFERAGRLLEEALALRPRTPWLVVCKAALLRQMDRREEALTLCGEALSLLPESGNAMEMAAGLLVELNREHEAEELLQHGCSITEIPDLRWQLYTFYSERELPDEALHWLTEYERYSPMLPEKARTVLRGNRATLLLLRGDVTAARENAAACGNPFYEKLAAALERPESAAGRRLRIPVGFVRQHHMTCGPATLAALAAYWGRPAPHLEIAEKICYDGTSHYSERNWAHEQGLDGREFRATPEVTRALVSRGVPFTLVTTWATGAHLQAVIGTDDRAGLLIIRDPTHPHYAEAHLEGFLKDYEAHGPRSMLVLPAEKRTLVDGVTLPEAELYDMVHAVEAALQGHHRTLAQQWFDHLCQHAPGHRLTWQAQLSLAAYDDNPVKSHEALTALAALYPEDAPIAWRAFRSMRERRPRGESLEELERRTRDPKCDPVFHTELARMLADDDRTARRATHLLHRLLRRNPSDAQALTTLAHCRWAARAFDDALELFRLAACAADKNEVCAAGYSNACRQLNRAEEGIVFLRRRAVEFGHLSAAPHVTLADALSDLVRTAEAMQVIQAARRQRPEDGDLLIHEARLQVAQGHFEEAERLLTQAQTSVPPQQWHRHCAALERARGRTPQCIAHWQAVLTTEPTALDAHQHLARLIAEQDGVERTLALLALTTTQWPWHMGFARLYVDWLRRAGRAEAETELRRIVAANPADDWAWRELALVYSDRQQHEAALAAAGESLRLAPSFATSHSVHGIVLRNAGRSPEAHAAARQALTLDVNSGAMHLLMETAGEAGARRRDVAFLRDEMARQTTGGEAVAQFRDVARALLTSQELTAILREGNRARPDLFETWFTLVEHLLATEGEDVLEMTRAFTARFPWAPGTWLLYSRACALAGLRDERLAALQRAVDINPLWSLAVRDLAELHEREGRHAAALSEMERLVRASPLDPANHGVLADMLLRQGRTEEGIAALEQAVAVEPGYDWGWGELVRQCRRAETPDRASAAAQKLVAERPDEPRSWTVLAETLGRQEQWPEALTEVERALLRWPRNPRLCELRAIILNAMGRRREAVAACAPEAFGGAVPRELRARHASLLLDAAEYAGAETILEELIVTEPDYAWPRSLLYDLCRARGDNARCLELSRDLVRIEPDSSVAAGMLAESLINAGNSTEAMSAVRRALELDPRYTYAAGRLFDDVLTRRDFTAAEELLSLIDRFQAGPRAHLARARLALARGRHEEVLRPAMELIQSDEPECEWALSVLLDEWNKDVTAPHSRMDQLLTAAVREGRAKNPGVSTRWTALHKSSRVADEVRAAVALPVPPRVRDAIIRDLLYAASDGKLHDAALRTVKENSQLLRSSTMLWGAVSYVFFQAGRHRELIDWCADWKDRTDREPWMMANVALALAWDVGPLAAAPAWEEVLAAGASNVWVQAAAGLAFTSAINGRQDDARRYLDNLKNQELSPEDRFSTAFARAALAAASAGQAKNPANRKRAGEILSEAVSAWPKGADTSRGRHYRRELAQFIARHGYDPAFANVRRPGSSTSSTIGNSSRTGQPRQAGGISRWLHLFIVILGVVLVRGCLQDRPASTPPPAPPRLPGNPASQDPYKNLPPEQQERLERVFEEARKRTPGEPARPAGRRSPSHIPQTESPEPPPSQRRGGNLELKY